MYIRHTCILFEKCSSESEMKMPNRIYLIAIGIHILIWNIQGKSQSCITDKCTDNVMVPLLDNQKSPLIATFDMSEANKHINQFIAHVIEEKMENLTKTKLEEVLEFLNLEDNIKEHVNEVKRNLNASISNSVQKMLTEEIKKGRSMMKPEVTFMASLSKTIDLETNTVIKFDEVKINIGRGYDPITGVFTAPQSGIYQFSVNFIKGNSDNWLELNLIKNNNLFVKGHAAIGYHTSGSLHAIVELKKGDRIFVRNPRSYGRINGGGYSMFSGLLL